MTPNQGKALDEWSKLLAKSAGCSIEHARALLLRKMRQEDEDIAKTETGGGLDEDASAYIDVIVGVTQVSELPEPQRSVIERWLDEDARRTPSEREIDLARDLGLA